MPRTAPDLIYARDLGALWLLRSSGVPLMLELHDLPDRRVAGFLTGRLLRHRNMVGVVVISQRLKDDLIDAHPELDPEGILVAHDAADDPGSAAVDWPRGEAGREVIVGYVGHLYPGKGMEVVQALATRLPDCDYRIVGGMERDILYWRQRLGEGLVSFQGYLPHGMLAERYGEFDICLLPIQSKVTLQRGKGDIGRWTSPLKLFEYMAHGRAIVASEVPVLKEVLTHERNALLVPPDSVDGWVSAVKRLKEDPDLRQSLGRQARADFLQHHTWHERAGRVLEFFRQRENCCN